MDEMKKNSAVSWSRKDRKEAMKIARKKMKISDKKECDNG